MCKVNKYRLNLDKQYAPKLVREGTYEVPDALESPLDAVNILNDKFHLNAAGEEFVYMISMDVQLRPLGIFCVSQGGISQAYVEIRGIMERALLSHASTILLAHNHPSGNLHPSEQDFEMTRNLNQACNIMNLQLADHVIIGDGYYSFRSNGLIEDSMSA